MGQSHSKIGHPEVLRAYIYKDYGEYSAGLHFANQAQQDRCFSSHTFSEALRELHLTAIGYSCSMQIIGISDEKTALKTAQLFQRELHIEKWWELSASGGEQPIIKRAWIDCRHYSIGGFTIKELQNVDRYFASTFIQKLPRGIIHRIFPVKQGICVRLFHSHLHERNPRTIENLAKEIHQLAEDTLKVQSWKTVCLNYTDHPVPAGKILVTDCTLHIGNESCHWDSPSATLRLISPAAAKECISDTKLTEALAKTGLRLENNDHTLVVYGNQSNEAVQTALSKYFDIQQTRIGSHDWREEQQQNDGSRERGELEWYHFNPVQDVPSKPIDQ